MAERQIRYCRTSEGRSIAYFAVGSGQTLIGTPPHLGASIMRETHILGRITDLTSRAYTYVRFDPHGCGLSDRGDDDLTVESFVRDIEAVADATAPEPFVLFANGMMTAPAMVYAARHPKRLTHLLLWMVMSHGADFDTPATEQITDMALTDWKLATESGMRAVDNWEHEAVASEMAALMRDSVTPETHVKFEKARAQWDVREVLREIKTPTLIMHPRNQPYFPPSIAQRAAAEIPGSRLALIEGATVLFPDASIGFVAGEFLGTTRRRERPQPASGTAVILFTDIADSTALTERIGDTRFRELSRALDAELRAAIRECNGTTVEAKTLGDGVLATFASAAQAIDGAHRCLALSAASELGLHIGVHAGDVIREEDNVFGGAVNIASRICGLSAPGEILVSDVVRGMARSSAGVAFDDRGEQELKGVADPVHLYAVLNG